MRVTLKCGVVFIAKRMKAVDGAKVEFRIEMDDIMKAHALFASVAIRISVYPPMTYVLMPAYEVKSIEYFGYDGYKGEELEG